MVSSASSDLLHPTPSKVKSGKVTAARTCLRAVARVAVGPQVSIVLMLVSVIVVVVSDASLTGIELQATGWVGERLCSRSGSGSVIMLW